jgi:broad specificity phosphatase PhoE
MVPEMLDEGAPHRDHRSGHGACDRSRASVARVELFLVRHAQPDWSPGGRARNDPDLTPLGRRQAARLTGRRWGRVDELWVSPMTRARQTAEPLTEALGLEPRIVEWAQEINNPPEWEGSPVDEVAELFAGLNLRSIDEMWDGLPGGETFRGFHRRVTVGIDGAMSGLGAAPRADARPHLWDEPADRRVVLVAHGGTNAVILGHLLGMDPTPWEWDRFDSAHTSVATLLTRPIAHAVAFGLIGFGDVGHLDPDEVTR